MSDVSQGQGWWIASDGKWYPPELHPGAPTAQPPPVAPLYGFGIDQPTEHGRATESLASWAPTAADPMEAPPVAAYPGDGGVGGYGPPQSVPPIRSGYSARAEQPLPVMPTGGRFRRGLRLVGIGFTMVRDEPGLMLVPIVAFMAQVVILAVAILAMLPTLRSTGNTDGQGVHLSAAQWVLVVIAGIAVTFVSVVSHATIIARVTARFHGRSVSNTKAAGAALTKSPQLFAWAFINYIVISLIRNIGNRGIFGLLFGAALRAGWMLASFFVVPVILFEDMGAVAAIKRSISLCRSRWGENIIGNGALGVIGLAAVLVDILVSALLGSVFAPVGAVVGILGLAAIMLVLTVASAAFNAALYWYAVTDQSPGDYSVGDLQAAYRRQGKRTGIYGF